MGQGQETSWKVCRSGRGWVVSRRQRRSEIVRRGAKLKDQDLLYLQTETADPFTQHKGNTSDIM